MSRALLRLHVGILVRSTKVFQVITRVILLLEQVRPTPYRVDVICAPFSVVNYALLSMDSTTTNPDSIDLPVLRGLAAT